MKRRRIYSFDVFDTCLARLCGEPRLMFDVLSLKVQKFMGEQCGEHLRQSFVVARAESGGRSLSEIYSNVAQRFPIPCSIEEMVALELETEKDLLVPIIATRKLVNNLREKGDVIFISDMYLPSSFIQERLIEHGFFKEGDRIYVSDELQAWKSDASLFRHVHKQEDIVYRQWHHYGDNRHSDYIVPRHLGIHAHHLKYAYLPYEEQWYDTPTLQYQYPAIFAGVSRAIRLCTDAPDDQKAFVCDISAPLMVSWVMNIMSDAHQRGIRRLYFCARDTHSEYLIACRLKPLYPEVEIRYLFISGPALYKSPLCVDYLIQEGFADKISMGIVDTCTSGKTLNVLNQHLSDLGLKPVFGYFLIQMISPDGQIQPDTDLARYSLKASYIEVVAHRKVKRIGGMRILPELLFSLNYHKKTYGYEYHCELLRPIFKDDDDDQWEFDGQCPQIMKRNNDTILSKFTDAFVQVGLHQYSADIFNSLTLKMFTEYIDYPRKEYLNYLHHFIWWGHPFVGSISGKKKGVWQRGNYFYSLPVFFSNCARHILGNTQKRRRLNQLLTWIKQK